MVKNNSIFFFALLLGCFNQGLECHRDVNKQDTKKAQRVRSRKPHNKLAQKISKYPKTIAACIGTVALIVGDKHKLKNKAHSSLPTGTTTTLSFENSLWAAPLAQSNTSYTILVVPTQGCKNKHSVLIGSFLWPHSPSDNQTLQFHLFGGGADPYETPLSTLVRELREEVWKSKQAEFDSTIKPSLKTHFFGEFIAGGNDKQRRVAMFSTIFEGAHSGFDFDSHENAIVFSVPLERFPDFVSRFKFSSANPVLPTLDSLLKEGIVEVFSARPDRCTDHSKKIVKPEICGLKCTITNFERQSLLENCGRWVDQIKSELPI